MTIQVILKSGVTFDIKCSTITLKRNGLDQVVGYVTANKPVYLDFSEVAAIVRTLGDEVERDKI